MAEQNRGEMIGAGEVLFGNEAIRWVQQLFGTGHPFPFRVLSLLGDTWGMILVAGLALWLFGRERMYAVVAIVVAGALTKQMLSSIFQQSRPRGPEIEVYEHLTVSSFPSGHVYQVVGPWGLLYATGCVPLWLAVAVPAAVGLGRLYLGVHYLGDVLGGFAFAIPFVWAFVRVWPHARAWLGRRSDTFHDAFVGVLLAAAAVWLTFVGGTPRRYEIVGMVAAGAVALRLVARGAPIWRAHDQRAEHGGPPAAWVRVLLGTAGIAVLALLDRSAGDAHLLGALAAGAATLWALLGAPALFRRLGGGAALTDA